MSRLTPCTISIAVSHKLVAIAYNGRPITLWDLEEDGLYGSCGKKLAGGETSTHMVGYRMMYTYLCQNRKDRVSRNRVAAALKAIDP